MPTKPALSHRERVRTALEHRSTDRIPIGMICAGINPPAYEDLQAYLEAERGTNPADYLAPLVDTREVHPDYVGPRLAADTDTWGVVRAPVCYGRGAYDEISVYPLAAAETPRDLDRHSWPDPAWFDYTGLPDKLRLIQSGPQGEFCLVGGPGNIFETAWYMRGFERILLDMLINPELVHALMERVCSYYVEYNRRVLQAAGGAIDLVFTADDLAGQRGPLMARAMWEEFIQPYHRRLNAAIHEFSGVRVIYHSDGAVQSLVDGLVAMGIDVLQALQFSADGMDPADLKHRFGSGLCFEGGVSVQSTLPHGSPDDVRAEVRHLIDTLGEGGGYILGPSHAIQAGTPPENICALFDTAAGYYPY
ncbi:MAG: uroporphyrinogen decarboxylase family protein [Anaerolineae bacterium]